MAEHGHFFYPDEPVLRAQFAKMICGVLDLPGEQPLLRYSTIWAQTIRSASIPNYRAWRRLRPEVSPWAWPRLVGPGAVSRERKWSATIVRAAGLLRLVPRLPPLGYTGALGAFDLEHGSETMRIAEYNGLLSGRWDTGLDGDPWQPPPVGEVADVLWHLPIIDR